MAVDKVDAILARFPGPVKLRVNRLKMLPLSPARSRCAGEVFLMSLSEGIPNHCSLA